MKKENGIYFLFGAFVFLCLFLFFTQINPIVILDGDDWYYISYSRSAIPLFGDWNPCRIFPEVFMRACTEIGVYIINPFLNDYISSISFAYGLVISIFITIYIIRFQKLMQSQFQLSRFSAIALSLLFLLFHFWIFRRNSSGNYYLFGSSDATCYFYYVIPNLLNASLVMFFLEKRLYSFKDYKSKVLLSFIIVCVYFAVFSNLFPSIILASLFGWVIVKYFIKNLQTKTVFSNLKTIQLPIVGMILWIISLVFEAMGGRAADDSLNESGGFNLFGSMKNLLSTVVSNSNRAFLLFVLTVIAVSIGLFIKNNKDLKSKYKNIGSLLITALFCMVLSTVYLVLLSARVNSEYIKRTEVFFCIAFYFFIILSSLLCLFIKKPIIKAILPLLLIIAVSITFTGSRTFFESNNIKVDSAVCKKIDDYCIKQIVDTDSNGLAEVELHVPIFDTSDNWPISDICAARMSESLYQHHVINHRIKVNVILDNHVNEQLGLEIKN